MFRKKAFTLIELLVVIAIIALLVSILLPSLNKAKTLAKAVICQSNLRNTGLVMTMYSSENENCTPPSYDWNFGSEEGVWSYMLANSQGEGDNVALFQCPSMQDDHDDYYTVYGMLRDERRTTDTSPAGAFYIANDIIPSLSNYVLLADSLFNQSMQAGGGQFQSYRVTTYTASDNRRIQLRHNEKANLLCYDAHVETVDEDRMLDCNLKAAPRGFADCSGVYTHSAPWACFDESDEAVNF